MKRSVFFLSSYLLLGSYFLLEAQPALDIRQGLVAYWPLDAVSEDGLTTPDQSPFAHNLNLVNMDAGNFSTAGVRGNAATFNGTDEILSLIYNLGEDRGLPVYGARKFTVTLWVNGVGATQGGTGTGDRRVFSEGNATGNTVPLFNIGTDSAAAATRTNVVDMFIRTDANTAVINHVKSARMAFDGTWHHIAWVEENGRGRLYIDGQLDATVFNYTRGTLTLNAVSLGGIQRAVAGSFYAGLIDEAAIWERALTQSEIQQLINNGIETPIPELPPMFTFHPTGGSRSQGDRVVFTAKAVGNRPISYRWFKDGVELFGETSPALVRANLTEADNGTYWAEASNFDGVINSSNAILTVVPDPAPDIRRGLVSYWPFNDLNGDDLGNTTTPDLYSRNDMMLFNMDLNNLVNGVLGNAFSLDGAGQYAFRKGGSPIYNNTAYSVALWINGNGLGQSDRRFFAEGGTNSNNPLFNLGTQSGGLDGTIRVFIRNDGGTVLLDRLSTGAPLDGNWHHIVWTETNGQGRLYIDGQLGDSDFTYTRGALTLHHTSVGAILRAAASSWFAGVVDEVAVWNRKLTLTEIQDVFADGVPAPIMALPPTITRQPENQSAFAGETVAFLVQASGTEPLHYQWRRNEIDIEDATNSVLTLAGVPTSDAGTYSVEIENEAGTVLSSNAVLIVEPVDNITSGLVAHWPLDELTEVSPDLTTNGNHMLPVNMDASNIVPGRRNNAFSFNGTDELLVHYNTNGFGLPVYTHTKYTVTLWANGVGNAQPTTPANGDRRVFAEGSTANNAPLLNIGTDNANGTLSADIFIRTDDNTAVVSHRKSINNAFDGTWHHIAWVDNNGTAQLYIDGVLDTTDFNYARGALTLNTTSIGGIVRAAHGLWFQGLIDDVAVWRRALSAEEILYAMENGPVAPSAFRILSIETSGGNITLTISTSSPSSPHRVVSSDDLGNPNWVDVSGVTFTPGAGNTLTAQFAAPVGAGQRFYRIATP